MSSISFFTPIDLEGRQSSFWDGALESVESYLSICPTQKYSVLLIKGDQMKMALQESAENSWVSIAFKIISYLTIILPLIALVAKVILRCKYNFSVVEATPLNILLIKGRLISIEEEFQWCDDMKVHTQALNDRFYYLAVPGDGNCFYSSYFSGWLYHLVQGASETIRGHLNQIGDRVDAVLRRLIENPDLQTVNTVLQDRELMSKCVAELRAYAVGQLHDEEAENLICDTTRGTCTKEEYIARQGKNGVWAQAPEIMVLFRHVCPLGVYKKLNERGYGFDPQLSLKGPIYLFHRNGNHFDALILKKLVYRK